MVIYLTKTEEELELNSDKHSEEIIDTNLNQNNINTIKKIRFLDNLKLSSISSNNNNNKLEEISIIGSNIDLNTISSTNIDENEETPETTTSSIKTDKQISCQMNDTLEHSRGFLYQKIKKRSTIDPKTFIITNDNNTSSDRIKLNLNKSNDDLKNNGNSGNQMISDRNDEINESTGSSTSLSLMTENNTNSDSIDCNNTDNNSNKTNERQSEDLNISKENTIKYKVNKRDSNCMDNEWKPEAINTYSPSIQTLPTPQLGSSTSTAYALLICRKNSHPFSERRLSLDAPVKIGRAVARCKPSNDNSIFDCKVLSRNHALLWCEDGKFYLQDTRSSNGTFINNQRLSPANDESQPREVCSGDIVQFGVDVMENSRKVTHGCIIATIKLFLPDGTEAKASRVTQSEEMQFNTSQMQNQLQTNAVSVTSQELYELSQYLNEAIHREQILENKLETLQRVVTNAQESAHSGWKSLVEEDRLLSRIETLQSKLEVCLNSNNNNNKGSNSGETSVTDIREEMLKLIDDKEKYECAAKEAIQKALEEKLLVLTRLHEIETSIKSSEEECNRLQEVCESSAKEINRLSNCNDELIKEIDDISQRLKSGEEQRTAITETAKKERQLLEEKIQELKAKETETSDIIMELKAINETANKAIEQLKLQLVVIKQEKVISDGNSSGDNNDSNDNNIKMNLEEELINVRKQLELSNKRSNELSAQIDDMKQQTISTVTLTDSIALPIVETNEVLTNGEILSTNSDNNNSEQESVIMEVNVNKDSNSLNQTTSQLNSEIDLLKELLAETRASKKSVDEELSRTSLEIENLRSNSKRLESELDHNQQKVIKALNELEEKSIIISSMKSQINDLSEKLKRAKSECETINHKIAENLKLLNLKDDEISSLKGLLEEERKIQVKYANNYDQCRKQLSESQLLAKQSQTEAELLRKKVYSCNEELRSSRSNLSTIDETNKSSKDYEKLKNECISLKSKLHSVESELLSYRDSNTKLVVDYKSLQNSFDLLQKINSEIESRGDNYWREQFNASKSDAEDAHSQLTSVREQFEELKRNFEDLTKDTELRNEELKSVKEDYEIVSYQSKIASACAIIPLFMLLIAVLMAYYPSVSSVTGTADL